MAAKKMAHITHQAAVALPRPCLGVSDAVPEPAVASAKAKQCRAAKEAAEENRRQGVLARLLKKQPERSHQQATATINPAPEERCVSFMAALSAGS